MDEYDDQSTSTELVGVYDNEKAATQAIAYTYLSEYIEYCLGRDTGEDEDLDTYSFGDNLSTHFDVREESEARLYIKKLDAQKVVGFFTDNLKELNHCTRAEKIWSPEMDSCDQTFMVLSEESDVRSTFFPSEDEENEELIDQYEYKFEFRPSLSEAKRYSAWTNEMVRTKNWSAEFDPKRPEDELAFDE
tara:strand:- start:4175 stop:4744 length:570 start_codon:yes stop_codon:yes gene_type:complete